MSGSPDFFDAASLIAAHDEGNAFDAVVPPIVARNRSSFFVAEHETMPPSPTRTVSDSTC